LLHTTEPIHPHGALANIYKPSESAVSATGVSRPFVIE
jgi:hypothetical protein